MAGDWIKMRVSLLDDPRVLRLAELLHIDDVDLVIGKLFRLWCHADQNSTDGSLRFATPGSVNRLLGYPGFAQALLAIGWIEVSPCCVTPYENRLY